MGVEMTLLRALAFHPRMPLPDPEVPRQSFAPVAPTAVMTPTQVPPQPQSAPQQAPTVPARNHQPGGWRRASSCSVSNQQKRVNRQPLPRAAGE